MKAELQVSPARWGACNVPAAQACSTEWLTSVCCYPGPCFVVSYAAVVGGGPRWVQAQFSRRAYGAWGRWCTIRSSLEVVVANATTAWQDASRHSSTWHASLMQQLQHVLLT